MLPVSTFPREFHCGAWALLPSISPRVAAVGGRCPEVSIPAGYSPAAQEDNINCTSEEVFTQESFMAPNHTKFSCKFTADMLQNCSGLVDPNFGFEEGKPCFIIKMNRVSIKGLEIRDPVRGLLWRLLWGGGSGCVAHPATTHTLLASRGGGPDLHQLPLPHSALSYTTRCVGLSLLLSNTN